MAQCICPKVGDLSLSLGPGWKCQGYVQIIAEETSVWIVDMKGRARACMTSEDGTDVFLHLVAGTNRTKTNQFITVAETLQYWIQTPEGAEITGSCN